MKLPPVQIMLFGKRYQSEWGEVEKLEDDLAKLGTCYMKVKADGSLTRIAPKNVSYRAKD